MTSVGLHRFFLAAAAGFAVATGAPAQAIDRVMSASAEFPAETAALVAATSAFFEEAERAAAKDERPSQPVIGLPTVVSPVGFEASDPQYVSLTERGPVRHLTGYGISWYPTDRLLGVVDFMGTWDNNRNLVCGYVTWDVTAPDAPVLQSVQTSYVDMSELASADDEKVHETLLEANCAYGAIDINFAFFDVSN
jgi:hypothetical protein